MHISLFRLSRAVQSIGLFDFISLIVTVAVPTKIDKNRISAELTVVRIKMTVNSCKFRYVCLQQELDACHLNDIVVKVGRHADVISLRADVIVNAARHDGVV